MKPLVKIAISYIIGIFIAQYINAPFLYYYIPTLSIFLISLILFFKKKDFLANLFLLLTIFLMGIFFTKLHTYRPAHSIGSILASISADATPVLIGTIVDDPEKRLDRINLTDMLIRAEKIKLTNGWKITDGLVKVSVEGQSHSYKYGERIILRGKLRSPACSKNPGLFDYQRFLSMKNIFVIMWIKDDSIVKLGDGNVNPILRFSYQIKHQIKDIIYQTIPNKPLPCAGLLDGVMLGEKKGLNKEIMKWFANTGTLHILAVSGFNVGLVAGIFFFVFYWLFRVPKKGSALLSLLIIIIFAIITGCEASVVRASIMAGVIIFSVLLDRDTNLYNNLALSAIIILIYNPLTLFDVGFQLSFMCVLSILYFTPLISPKLSFLPVWLSTPLAVSIGVQIGISPFLIYYFNKLSIITILANLMICPLVVIISWLGFALFFAGLFSSIIANVIASVTYFFVFLLLKLIYLFANIPFACLTLQTPPIIFICSYYLCIIAICNIKKLGRPRVVIGIALLVNILLWTQVIQSNEKSLKVTFLDVGHGDSIFIEFPKGGNMLIDGGKPEMGEYVVLPFLKKKGISCIDTVVSTHQDIDHIGGLIPVLKDMRVRRIVGNSKDKNLFVIDKVEIVHKGDEIRGYEWIRIYILHPSKLAQKDNDNSIVIKMIYNNISFLFTGDIELDAENDLIPMNQKLHSTILKVPHHGSKHSGNMEFIKLVNPKIAVIQIDSKNRFNLPDKDLLKRYRELGIKVFRTDIDGAITIVTDGNNFIIDK